MVDLLDMVRLLDSSVCDRDLSSPKLDLGVDFLCSWVNNSGSVVGCVVNLDRVFNHLVSIDLAPIDNAINVYVWYEVGGVLLYCRFILAGITDFKFF